MSFIDLVQGNVAPFLPYRMNKPLDVIQKEMKLEKLYRMHALENPYGVSKRVLSVLAKYVNGSTSRNAYPAINLYPDNACYNLKQKLHDVYRYDVNRIVVGSGVHELSSLITHTFLHPGMTAVMPYLSSYDMEMYLSMQGVRLAITPISEDWSPNFDEMAKTVQNLKANMVYIANPSIPLGGFAVRERFVSFLSKINCERTIVVINEEFIDYLGGGYQDLYSLLDRFPNLILLRSFSHAFGLADQRVAYLVTSDEISSILNTLQTPYAVSQLAQDCACAALSDMSFMQHVIKSINVERNRIREFCTFFSLRVVDTVTNSITIPFGGLSNRVYHELQKDGFFVRDLSYFKLNGLLNFTIGRDVHTDALLLSLERILLNHVPQDERDEYQNLNRQTVPEEAQDQLKQQIKHQQNNARRSVDEGLDIDINTHDIDIDDMDPKYTSSQYLKQVQGQALAQGQALTQGQALAQTQGQALVQAQGLTQGQSLRQARGQAPSQGLGPRPGLRGQEPIQGQALARARGLGQGHSLDQQGHNLDQQGYSLDQQGYNLGLGLGQEQGQGQGMRLGLRQGRADLYAADHDDFAQEEIENNDSPIVNRTQQAINYGALPLPDNLKNLQKPQRQGAKPKSQRVKAKSQDSSPEHIQSLVQAIITSRTKDKTKNSASTQTLDQASSVDQTQGQNDPDSK